MMINNNKLMCMLYHCLQPPYVGAKCCEPDCGALESCLWYKSKRAETLGKPLCKKCNDRAAAAAKKALKVGRFRLTLSNPC
jgi:hypothetical protein